MTAQEREVLQHIQDFVRVRDFFVRTHGRQRSKQRNATVKDMRAAILGATHCLWQPEYDTYRVSGGKDLAEMLLDVIVVVERNEVTNELGEVSVQNVLDPS